MGGCQPVDFSPELSNVWVFYGRVGFTFCFTSQDGLCDRVSGKLGRPPASSVSVTQAFCTGLVWLTDSETGSVFVSQDRNRRERQRGHATHDWEGFPKTTVV